MSHEGTKRKPQTVEHREVVDVTKSRHSVLNLPLVRTESAHEKQHSTDRHVRDDDTEPDLRVEWVHEREDVTVWTGYEGTVSRCSGSMNEKIPGFCLSGFLIMMLMPSCMNGLLKSMTRSRTDVMVNGAIAISASCVNTSPLVQSKYILLVVLPCPQPNASSTEYRPSCLLPCRQSSCFRSASIARNQL